MQEAQRLLEGTGMKATVNLEGKERAVLRREGKLNRQRWWNQLSRLSWFLVCFHPGFRTHAQFNC